MNENKDNRLRFLARVVIELLTPLQISSGSGDDASDVSLLTDANGLAAIPGDSLRGALRAIYRADGRSEEDIKDLFGQVRAEEDGSKTGIGSRLTLSWGHVHDAQNLPVVGLLDPRLIALDEVLRSASVGELREHAGISHRGGAFASKRSLRSEYCLCAGHRFTFEIDLIGKVEPLEAKEEFNDLLAFFNSPVLRLGGKSRSGYGAFAVHAIECACFDLTDRWQFDLFARYSPDLSQPDIALKPLESIPEGKIPANALCVCLPLQPNAYWMFGGGEDAPDQAGTADIAPVRTARVHWKVENGTQCGSLINDLPLFPASGIKGAVAHRVAFHYNLLNGVFADQISDVDRPADEVTEAEEAPHQTGPAALAKERFIESEKRFAPHVGVNNDAVAELFGRAKGDQEQPGQRGRVLIDDLLLENNLQSRLITHAPLGRFSGGVLNLFSERPFWRGDLPPLRLLILDKDQISSKSRLALFRTLEDLAGSRLQVGSGSGRGLGFFHADEDDWQEKLTRENWHTAGEPDE